MNSFLIKNLASKNFLRNFKIKPAISILVIFILFYFISIQSSFAIEKAVPKDLQIKEASLLAIKPTSGINVFATIPPIAFFVEEIGGNMVDVKSLINENDNPHTYAPKPRKIIQLGRSRMIFTVQMPFERSLINKLKTLTTGPEIIDLTENVKFRFMGCGDHSHCNSHYKSRDPHIWFGPDQIKVIAANIAKALIAINGINGINDIEINKNLTLFLKKLDDLDQEIKKTLSPCKGNTVLVFHPSFGYFTDAFHLKQESVEVEGKSPSPRQIIKLITKAKKNNIHTIFVQPQFDTKAALNIATAINGKVIPINPIKKNVFNNMQYMANEIKMK